MLGRRYPAGSEYVTNLLRRNWYQVRGVKRVYAVARLESDGLVQGGTAWAVSMARARGVPVYLFDQTTSEWLESGEGQRSWERVPRAEIPVPSGAYAGVGSRRLSYDGADAIHWLYERGERGD